MNGSLTSTLLGCAALVAGALVPFQAGSNAALGRTLGHPLWATLVSLLISLLVLLPVLLSLRVPAPLFGHASQLPLWGWLGGLAGVIYISAALLITPRLGATGFIVCVIAGQMLASLLIDNFGLMGLPQKEINVARVAGVLLILIGMLVVQWSSVAQPASSANATAVQSNKNSG
jgi:transporter family-2 protein